MRTLPLPLSRQFAPLLSGAKRRSAARPRVRLPPAWLPRSALIAKAQGRCVVRCAHPCALLCGRSRRLVGFSARGRVPPPHRRRVSYLLVCCLLSAAASPSSLRCGAVRRSRRLRRRWVCVSGAAGRLPPLAHSPAVRAGGVRSACLVCSHMPLAPASVRCTAPQSLSA